MKEVWKQIPGYEGIYEASTFGNIRTALGKTTSSKKFARRVWKQRLLKQKLFSNSKGRTDARICLWKDGLEKTWLVSRLIALTFCDGYASDLTVNHIDGNPLNNRADNLEWISLSENIVKGFENGLYPQLSTLLQSTTNGEKIKFRSMSEASRFLERNKGYIGERVKRNKQTVFDAYGNAYLILPF